MLDIKNIATGFINATRNYINISDPEVEKKAIERYEICLKCDTISDSKTQCDKLKGGCGCLLFMKTRSESSCPKGKWS